MQGVALNGRHHAPLEHGAGNTVAAWCRPVRHTAHESAAHVTLRRRSRSSPPAPGGRLNGSTRSFVPRCSQTRTGESFVTMTGGTGRYSDACKTTPIGRGCAAGCSATWTRRTVRTGNRTKTHWRWPCVLFAHVCCWSCVSVMLLPPGGRKHQRNTNGITLRACVGPNCSLAMQDAGRGLALHIWCAKGRHRSVAAAILIGRELQSRGETVEIVHLDLPFRPCSVTGCTECVTRK